jgi:proteic killer suppression protein
VWWRQLPAVNKKFTIQAMIKTFSDPETAHFFETGRSRKIAADILKRAAMRLLQLHNATSLEDLRLPPSNRLEKLAGDRGEQWSIRINQQWRVCFRFDQGNAYDVEIVDYH